MSQPRQASPLNAILFGLFAGAVGSAVQSLFFKASARITPETSKEVFAAPEAVQKGETATQTVARRLIENFMQRGPLTEDQKRRGGELVHFGFGSAWGALYGVLRRSFPEVSDRGLFLLFGTLVWMSSDNLILPAFRLAAWPHRYPFKNHLYAWAAHLVYGAAVFGAFRLAEGVTQISERRESPWEPGLVSEDVSLWRAGA